MTGQVVSVCPATSPSAASKHLATTEIGSVCTVDYDPIDKERGERNI